MGLVKWDAINDYFSHEQLAANFQVLDSHDHTPGKGEQIPYGGLALLAVGPENIQPETFNAESLANESITGAKVANGAITDAKLASPNNSSYRVIFQTGGSLLEEFNAGLYILMEPFLWPNSTGAYERYVKHFWYDGADYTVAGKTTRMRLRVHLLNDEVKAAFKATLGLYPITITGGVGSVTATLGTVVAGSTVEFNEVNANTATSGVSTEFTALPAGPYAVGMVNNVKTPANSNLHIGAQLQLHYV